ncbi:hypothetical protein PhCBS80983_g00355 [Powellomyces hirtus]|uniref:F-box domain-containing protein n=1 Tax=Powellomyces hirtus TaxID=109895 RepID=A0A507EH24_9FUNG|nr:hypothetical protein PhCBS80983_g00355 [Powellomyces hirtus]
MSRILTLFRGLTVCLGQEHFEKEAALLSAYFMLAERITLAKDHSTSSRRVLPQSSHRTLPKPSDTTRPTAAIPIDCHVLPAELLPHIFEFLDSASDLGQCLLVSRRWYRGAIPYLYRYPRLGSLRAIRLFSALVTKTEGDRLWDYSCLVRRIYFTSGSGASQSADNARGGELLGRTCSSLFRMLVMDRKRDKDAAAHSLFFDLTRCCANLEAIEESEFYTIKDERSVAAARPDSFVLTQTVLQNLLTACRHAMRTSQRLGVDPVILTRVCTVLLELFQGEGQPMWRGIERHTLRVARTKVLDQCRISLNQLSTAMYLESQYLALSAQRLLDQYALMYYRGFSGASQLDIDFVVKAAARDEQRNGNDVDPETIVSHDSILIQVLRLVFHQPLTAPTTLRAITAPVSPTSLWASLPEELATLFVDEPPVPSFAFPSREFLEDALSVFPPQGMNAETAELVAELLDNHEPTEKYLYPDHEVQYDKWIAWFRDIIVWQRGGEEMEAVKDLLRTSMARMEMFRGLQRNFGMVFM